MSAAQPYARKTDAFVFDVKMVETVPAVIEDGVLYVSEKYGTAIHLCACGCGEETVTPLKPLLHDGWDCRNENGLVTLSPSISNAQFCPNKAHYFFERNRVRWA